LEAYHILYVSSNPFFRQYQADKTTKDDDGFILYESRAITRYIAAKYANQGTRLLPPTSDAKAYALAEQALNVEAFNFDPFAVTAAREAVIKP
jgi:glutathione S-transferase